MIAPMSPTVDRTLLKSEESRLQAEPERPGEPAENDAGDGVSEITVTRPDVVPSVSTDIDDQPKLVRIRQGLGRTLEKSDREIAASLLELVPPQQCSHRNDPRTCSICGTDRVSNEVKSKPISLPSRPIAEYLKYPCIECHEPLTETDVLWAFEAEKRIRQKRPEICWVAKPGKIYCSRWECANGLPVPETESANELENIERAVAKILNKHKRETQPRPSRRERKFLDRAYILSNKDLSLRLHYRLSPRQLVAILDKEDSVFWAEFEVTDEVFGRTDTKMRKWLREIENGNGRSVYKTITRSTDTIWATNKGSVLVRPGTMAEWKSLLPLKKVKVLTETEAAFYRDYAARNLTVAEMKAKYGEVSDESIRSLENKIVRRAFYCRLLNAPLGVRPADFERDLDEGWALEKRAIARGHAYIGSIHGSNDPGSKPTRLRTPLPRARYGPDAPTPTDAGLQDDYGEESES